jgi:hypothetical protein
MYPSYVCFYSFISLEYHANARPATYLSTAFYKLIACAGPAVVAAPSEYRPQALHCHVLKPSFRYEDITYAVSVTANQVG